MAPKKSAALQLISLATLVAATQSANGFMFASPEAIQPLIDTGDAEFNPEMVNPANAGEFGARATAQGIKKNMDATNTQAGNTAAENTTGNTATGNAQAPASNEPSKPVFARAVRPMTPMKRNTGPGAAIYPFDDLAAPQGTGDAKQVDAFFVAATAAKPKPEESMQSAVSAATRRYATQNGTKSYTKKGKDGAPDTVGTRATYAYTRKFRVVAGDYTPEGSTTPVKGAWIERVQ